MKVRPSRRLVLASASPRRRDLLGHLVSGFEIQPSEIDERLGPGPLEAALEALALDKARAVAQHVPDALVLAADTVVVVGGRVLGKPEGADDARAMLRQLRGRFHRVLTAVAVLDGVTGGSRSVVVESRVLMRAFDDDALERYVASGEPLDKAGAYAVQGLGGQLVAGVIGSYSNVVGLPLAATRALLAASGLCVHPWGSSARATVPSPLTSPGSCRAPDAEAPGEGSPPAAGA